MLSTQLQNAVIELLSQFISTDFGNLEKLKENFEAASQGSWKGKVGGREGGRAILTCTFTSPEHDQAIKNFSRLSKKRDSEKVTYQSLCTGRAPINLMS